MSKSKLIIILFVSFCIQTKAQELWYSSIHSVQQSYLNPAYIPKHKFIIGGFSPNLDFGTGGVKWNDFTTESEGTTEVSLQALSASINGDIKPYFQQNIHTVDIALSLGKGVVYGGHNVQFYGHTNIPKGFIDLAAFGNAGSIGKTITANIEGAVNVYQNFYVGYAHKFGKLSLGVRANWINGMFHFKSNNSKLEFTTSEDYYRLKLKSDYDFQSAGILYYDDINNDFKIDETFTDRELFMTGNNGFGVDVGAAYEFNVNSRIFASVLQLGSINWNERSNRYINQSEYEFIGYDIKDIVDDNIEFSIEDSIEQFLDLETNTEAFSSALPVKINLGAGHTIGKMDYQLGIQVVGIEQNQTTNISLAATRQIFNFLRAGLSYQIRPSSTANIGAMVDVKIGPCRGFVATQNILTALNPKNSKSFAFAAGFSLEIGKK